MRIDIDGSHKWLLAIGLCVVALVSSPFEAHADDSPVAVTALNFIRAETDRYFGATVLGGGFGKLRHSRDMASIDAQTVVRMNRDTIYSSGVFDLQAAPLTITLPDAGRRFMSLQVISEDHYTTEVVHEPGPHRYTQDRVGTRYAFIIIRTLANPFDATDMQAAHALQDAIRVDQASSGHWEAPRWDEESRKKVRDALAVLGTTIGGINGNMFGSKAEADPILHLIGTAVGWGGNPRSAAVYNGVYPKANDGRTAYQLTVRDVPVDGFWSVTVYNARGYFEKNDLGAYSLNNLTATPNRDGSFTIRFGGEEQAANYLPITPGWNYTMRLYRPRQEILDGSWKFPEAQPLRGQ